MNAIEELKKYDLHCHLDGSLSEAVIRKLASGAGWTFLQGKSLWIFFRYSRTAKA